MTKLLARASASRRGPGSRSAIGTARAAALLGSLFVAFVGSSAGAESARPGADASLAEIERCVTDNLPDTAGVIDFRVEAVDRTGVATASRAEMRWRQDESERMQLVLRVSEPAETAGTALLLVDREADQPEFFVRLPEIEKVRKVRAKRLRGPVLGTDFSYEDLKRLRDPLDRANLEVVGLAAVEDRPAWLLEAIPKPEDRSEYGRVLTYVDQALCMPLKIDLYGHDEKLRKSLHAPISEVRAVDGAELPHVFVMEDHRRETHTVVRIDDYEGSADLPAALFTKRALAESTPAATAR